MEGLFEVRSEWESSEAIIRQNPNAGYRNKKDCGSCRRSRLVLAPRPVWGPAAGERLIDTTRKVLGAERKSVSTRRPAVDSCEGQQH
jgi:hypothetical protein